MPFPTACFAQVGAGTLDVKGIYSVLNAEKDDANPPNIPQGTDKDIEKDADEIKHRNGVWAQVRLM